MVAQTFFSRNIVLLLSFITAAYSQSVPGASFFGGNGAPGVAAYQLVDDYQPSVFFNKFNFFSSYDPTNGHVQYVNKTIAVRNGFVSITNQSTVKIQPDTTNLWPRGGPGRPSVRVISDNTYTHGMFILDAVHMPWGCGAWPAYWLLGPNWPSNGEIDVIEGVNTQSLNDVSLHSSPGCSIAGSGQTATFQTSNCDTSVNYNSGCGSQLNDSFTPNNYGNGFNNNGGGVYVTEWTSNFVKTWFFPRGAIPASITSGNPDPSTFGIPAVNQQGSCVIDQHFNNMSIIINIDFCGDWGGEVYTQSPQCPVTPNASSRDSCVDFVGNNPQNMTSAYWDIKSLRVYQMPAAAVASSSYSTSLSSATGLTMGNTINKGMGVSTSVSSSQYTGPLSSVTTSAGAPSSTPIICPAYNRTTYTDNKQRAYSISCGYDYTGASTGMPGGGIVQTLSFEGCLETCDSTTGCLAVAFLGGNGAGNCYLKSTTGSLIGGSSANAAVRVNGAVSSQTSSAVATSTAVPVCPDSSGKSFTDTGGVVYNIACYQDFPGGNIGNLVSFDSIAACLPSCDAMSGCIGAVFNTTTKLCQLKSSFTGATASNNAAIAARKNVPNSPFSGSVYTPPGYGGYGSRYGYGNPGPGYGGYGYGGQSTTTSSRRSTSSSSSTSSRIASSTSASSSSSVGTTISTSRSSTSSSSTIPNSSMSLPTSFTIRSSSSSTSSSSSSSMTASTPSPSTVSSSSSLAASSSSSSSFSSTSSKVTSSSVTSISRSSSASSSSQSSTMITQSSSSSVLSSIQSPLPSMSATSDSILLIMSDMTTSSSTLSSTSGTGSSSSASSSITPADGSSYNASPTTSQSMTSMSLLASPCPTTTEGYCGSAPDQKTTCADSSGTVYSVSCGTLYTGEFIDTSNIYARMLEERALAQNVAACQALCNRYSTCVAFNYVGRNCALLDRIDGSVSSSNAVAGRLVIAAAASTTTDMSSPTLNPAQYGASSSTSTDSSLVLSSTDSSTSSTSPGLDQPSSSSGNGPPSYMATTITYISPPATVVVTTTTTQSVLSGSISMSTSAMISNTSITLCYNCALTPTVIYGPTPVPPPSNITCPASRTGTTTIYTTSTVTTCPPQPTCPAPGYVIIGGSGSYPGQQIVTTTGSSGQSITYTQIPTITPTGGYGGSGSGGSGGSAGHGPPDISLVTMTATAATSNGPGPTGEPLCPAANDSIYTDSYGMRYRINCETAFSDTTLDTQTQNTVSGCISSCDLYNIKSFYLGTQCFGVSYFSDRNSSNCLLKAGATRIYQRNCESCELLTPSRYNSTSTVTIVSASSSPYTTVIGGSTVVSTYTTTLPASTVTIYTTIFTNGVSTGTPIGYSTIQPSTVTYTTTKTVGGTTIVTQGPGGYYGAGNQGGGQVSTVYVVSTAVSTYISNGQTIYSTYGITTIASTVYLPGTTRTVTTTTTSLQITLSVQYVPTTIVTTTTQGITTTIVTSVPVTYTQTLSPQGGGGGGSGGNGPATITVTASGQGNGPQTVTYTQNNNGGVTTVYVNTGGSGSGGQTKTITQQNVQTVTQTQGNAGGPPQTITQTLGSAGPAQTITQTLGSAGSGGGVQTVTQTTGNGGSGGSNGTVTLTQPGGSGTTIFVTATVTQSAVPLSSSTGFTCRTYATNYLNGLDGRAEPTSPPQKVSGLVFEPIMAAPARAHKQSIFQRKVIMAEIDRMARGHGNKLTADLDYWFVE